MSGEIILYTTEDGQSTVQLKAEDGSAWLTQAQMAELFETSVSNINKPIKGILEDGEQPEATIEQFSIVQSEGDRRITRQVSHYSLPMIMAVGFRVRSPRGSQFRRWATATLSEYLIKGFVMDDARLKDPEADYFEELHCPDPRHPRIRETVLQEGAGDICDPVHGRETCGFPRSSDRS